MSALWLSQRGDGLSESVNRPHALPAVRLDAKEPQGCRYAERAGFSSGFTAFGPAGLCR